MINSERLKFLKKWRNIYIQAAKFSKSRKYSDSLFWNDIVKVAIGWNFSTKLLEKDLHVYTLMLFVSVLTSSLKRQQSINEAKHGCQVVLHDIYGSQHIFFFIFIWINYNKLHNLIYNKMYKTTLISNKHDKGTRIKIYANLIHGFNNFIGQNQLTFKLYICK